MRGSRSWNVSQVHLFLLFVADIGERMYHQTGESDVKRIGTGDASREQMVSQEAMLADRLSSLEGQKARVSALERKVRVREAACVRAGLQRMRRVQPRHDG